MISIPKLKKIVPEDKFLNKETYRVTDVLDFYLEDNKLYCFLNNNGKVASIRCLKNYDNMYKIFGYKTSGVLSHTKYLVLDVKNQDLFVYCGGQYATMGPLKKWIEYLLSGGSFELAKVINEQELNDFNPFI